MKEDINNRFMQTFMPLAKLVGKIVISKKATPGLLMNLQQRKLLTPHTSYTQEWQ
jgi:hypothetical protein